MYKLLIIAAVLAVAAAAPGLLTVNTHPVVAVATPVHHATVVRTHHTVVHHAPVVVKTAPIVAAPVVAAPVVVKTAPLIAAPVVAAPVVLKTHTPVVRIQHYPLYRTHPTFTRVHHGHTYGVTYAAHAPVVRVL